LARLEKQERGEAREERDGIAAKIAMAMDRIKGLEEEEQNSHSQREEQAAAAVGLDERLILLEGAMRVSGNETEHRIGALEAKDLSKIEAKINEMGPEFQSKMEDFERKMEVGMVSVTAMVAAEAKANTARLAEVEGKLRAAAKTVHDLSLKAEQATRTATQEAAQAGVEENDLEQRVVAMVSDMAGKVGELTAKTEGLASRLAKQKEKIAAAQKEFLTAVAGSKLFPVKLSALEERTSARLNALEAHASAPRPDVDVSGVGEKIEMEASKLKDLGVTAAGQGLKLNELTDRVVMIERDVANAAATAVTAVSSPTSPGSSLAAGKDLKELKEKIAAFEGSLQLSPVKIDALEERVNQRLATIETQLATAPSAVAESDLHELRQELKEHFGIRLENVIQSAAEARADINADLEEHLESSREERDGNAANIATAMDRIDSLEGEMAQISPLVGVSDDLEGAPLSPRERQVDAEIREGRAQNVALEAAMSRVDEVLGLSGIDQIADTIARLSEVETGVRELTNGTLPGVLAALAELRAEPRGVPDEMSLEVLILQEEEAHQRVDRAIRAGVPTLAAGGESAEAPLGGTVASMELAAQVSALTQLLEGLESLCMKHSETVQSLQQGQLMQTKEIQAIQLEQLQADLKGLQAATATAQQTAEGAGATGESLQELRAEMEEAVASQHAGLVARLGRQESRLDKLSAHEARLEGLGEAVEQAHRAHFYYVIYTFFVPKRERDSDILLCKLQAHRARQGLESRLSAMDPVLILLDPRVASLEDHMATVASQLASLHYYHIWTH